MRNGGRGNKWKYMEESRKDPKPEMFHVKHSEKNFGFSDFLLLLL